MAASLSESEVILFWLEITKWFFRCFFSLNHRCPILYITFITFLKQHKAKTLFSKAIKFIFNRITHNELISDFLKKIL